MVEDAESSELTQKAEKEMQFEESVFAMQDVDWALAFYIDLVEVSGVTEPIEVTLFLKGIVVTGRIIASSEYEKRTGLNAFVEKMLEAEKVPRLFSEQRRFIHLENAKFFMGSDKFYPSSEEGLLWRGKLMEIDAFVNGRLSANSDQS